MLSNCDREMGTMRVARQRRGFGRTRKLPSGRWQAFYNDPEGRTRLSATGKPTPIRHNAPHTFDSKLDAEAWLTDERRLISAGTWTSLDERREARDRDRHRKGVTFASYAERWITERRNSKGAPLAELTVDKYRTLLAVHILPTFGDRTLGSITRDDVRRWHAAAAPDRPTQRAHAYNLLRSILQTAVVDDELLEKNPAYVRGAGVRHRKKTVVPATLSELDVMVAAMPEQRQLMLLLATWCALRSGELRELRRSDITLGRDEAGDAFGWVRVRRGVVRARTGNQEHGQRTAVRTRAPKTAAGTRDVSIPDFLLPAVREHLLQHAAPGKDGLLFTSSTGEHLSESTFNGRRADLDADGTVIRSGYGWREARRLAGRDDLDFHDLRHTGASMAGEAGASMAELMHRLGHSTPSMAMLYQHSARERDREISRRLSARAEQAAT